MLLERMFNDDWPQSGYTQVSSADGRMRTDVAESDTAYELTMDLPGVKKEDVAITLKNGYLTVAAKASERKETEAKLIRRERLSTACSRSFYVANKVDAEGIKARYEDGVLTITLPKAKHVMDQRIEIE